MQRCLGSAPRRRAREGWARDFRIRTERRHSRERATTRPTRQLRGNRTRRRQRSGCRRHGGQRRHRSGHRARVRLPRRPGRATGARGRRAWKAPHARSVRQAEPLWSSPSTSPTYDQLDAAATQVEQEFGPIDVWVNVGFTAVFAPFHKISAAEFRRVTEVATSGTSTARWWRWPGCAAVTKGRSCSAAPRWVSGPSRCSRRTAARSTRQRVHRVGARGTAARQEQCQDHHRADARGEHATVLRGCSRGCPSTPSRFPRFTSPRWRPAASSTRPTTPGASSTGSAAVTVGTSARAEGGSCIARPVPGPHRLLLPADRGRDRPPPGRQPLVPRRRRRRLRLRQPTASSTSAPRAAARQMWASHHPALTAAATAGAAGLLGRARPHSSSMKAATGVRAARTGWGRPRDRSRPRSPG